MLVGRSVVLHRPGAFDWTCIRNSGYWSWSSCGLRDQQINGLPQSSPLSTRAASTIDGTRARAVAHPCECSTGSRRPREHPAFGDLAVDFGSALPVPFELLENDRVTGRSGLHQRRRDDRERTAVLDVARGAEEPRAGTGPSSRHHRTGYVPTPATRCCTRGLDG